MFANLTRSHRGPSPGYLRARKLAARKVLNTFAEHLSECGVIPEAARRTGISQQRGSQLFAQIRKELGWQAK